MRKVPGSDEIATTQNMLVDTLSVFRESISLLFGSITWWTSHYLLLWNAQIASTDSSIPGYDGRFILTVAATVVALGTMAFYSKRHPHFRFSRWSPAYPIFAATASIALAMLAASSLVETASWMSEIGALLSGVGGSFALLLYGELHARMGFRYIPLACALESITGVLLYFLLSQLSFITTITAAALSVIISAILYHRSAQNPITRPTVHRPVEIDMDTRSLIVLAILTGFAYGLMRTFATSGLEIDALRVGLNSECLGTSICALLLVAIFFLQNRNSLLEQCLLFVIPLVATGMVLIPLQNVGSVIPTAMNTGGFACFFNLMWYFAAVFAAHDDRYDVTYLIASLFFTSQAGQLAGALIPADFANALSSTLIYLLLLITILSMYWHRKAERRQDMIADGNSESPETQKLESLMLEFGLSPREAQIALLLAQRVPYKQIADSLFVSENTIKTHARNIYHKSDVTSREELIEKLDDLAKKG